MKKLFLIAALFLSTPVFAQTTAYRPFRYVTPCALEANGEYLTDDCVVIETRESSGALRTRNIFSNRFKITIKSRYDKEKGFMTWDSHNKFEYKFDYKITDADPTKGWTYVMPGVLLENVSWE